ncbi:hypothetical protein DFH09DRAFT_1087417 [Mycena vulgaris]|nr:hypothetical protein DFH09DRAFT_1087417 [Mycena vulgaris]
MRSVEHGAEGANCAPLAAIDSEHDSHIGFVLRQKSGHVPTVSQAQKMRREKGRVMCIAPGNHNTMHAAVPGKTIVSVLKTGYRYLTKISKSEKRPKYSCTYRYSGAGSEDKSRGIIRTGNEQLRDFSH